MSAGPHLFVDEATGKLLLPGRVTRTLNDAQIPGATASFWSTGWGTQTNRSWTNTNPNAAPGSLVYTTAATNGQLAGVRTAAPMASIIPSAFRALGVTFEGLRFDGDAGYDVSIGWYPSASSKGGVVLQQGNGQTAASVIVYDSAGTAHTFSVQYKFFTNGTGGLGGQRRNLSLVWLVYGGWLYVVEDDQIVVALDVSTYIDISDACYPAASIVCRDAAAHFMQFSQSSLMFNHD